MGANDPHNIHAMLARIDERTERADERLERVEHYLLGNGNPGVLVRVDRIEQKEQRRDRLQKLIISGMISLAVGLVLVGVKLFVGA